MDKFLAKPKFNMTRIMVLSFITIVLEVIFSLPFIMLFQVNKEAGENTWLIVGNFGLIVYPVFVYFGMSLLSLLNKEALKFSFLERLVAFMVFGNAVNFIIHLLTNIPEQFDFIKLLQTTFILFAANLVIRIVSIVLFEPFNLFIERYQRKTNTQSAQIKEVEEKTYTPEPTPTPEVTHEEPLEVQLEDAQPAQKVEIPSEE